MLGSGLSHYLSASVDVLLCVCVSVCVFDREEGSVCSQAKTPKMETSAPPTLARVVIDGLREGEIKRKY